MVIQRIQSLWLLVVSVVMCVATFGVSAGVQPLPGGEAVPVTLSQLPHLLVVNLLVAVLSFVAIFLYKNLRLQIKVTQITVVLAILALALYLWAFVFATPLGVTSTPAALCILYAVAIVFAVLAYRGEKHDFKLIYESERLR